MKRFTLMLSLLLIVLFLSWGDQGAIAQNQGFPTSRAEIMELNPQIGIVGLPGDEVETNPDLDDLAEGGSMMTLIEWPTVCTTVQTTEGAVEVEQTVLMAVSCGEQATFATQFIGACSANPNDPLGTMAGMVTQPGQLPVETFVCFPIPPD